MVESVGNGDALTRQKGELLGGEIGGGRLRCDALLRDVSARVTLGDRFEAAGLVEDEVIKDEEVSLLGLGLDAKVALFVQGRRESAEDLAAVLENKFGSNDWQMRLETGVIARLENYGATGGDAEHLTGFSGSCALWLWDAEVSLLPVSIGAKMLETRKRRRAYQFAINFLARLINAQEGRPRPVRPDKLDKIKIQLKRVEDRLDKLEQKRREQTKIQEDREAEKEARDQLRQKREDEKLRRKAETEEAKEEARRLKEEQENVKGEDHTFRLTKLQEKQKSIMSAFIKKLSANNETVRNSARLESSFLNPLRSTVSVDELMESISSQARAGWEVKVLCREFLLEASARRKVLFGHRRTQRYLYGTVEDGRRVKLLQFHENVRPPFHGTVSTKLAIVCGKNPFAKESSIDYDCVSEEDWQLEEDLGESLSDTDEEAENSDSGSTADDDDDGLFIDDGADGSQGYNEGAGVVLAEKHALMHSDKRKRNVCEVVRVFGVSRLNSGIPGLVIPELSAFRIERSAEANGKRISLPSEAEEVAFQKKTSRSFVPGEQRPKLEDPKPSSERLPLVQLQKRKSERSAICASIAVDEVSTLPTEEREPLETDKEPTGAHLSAEKSVPVVSKICSARKVVWPISSDKPQGARETQPTLVVPVHAVRDEMTTTTQLLESKKVIIARPNVPKQSWPISQKSLTPTTPVKKRKRGSTTDGKLRSTQPTIEGRDEQVDGKATVTLFVEKKKPVVTDSISKSQTPTPTPIKRAAAATCLGERCPAETTNPKTSTMKQQGAFTFAKWCGTDIAPTVEKSAQLNGAVTATIASEPARDIDAEGEIVSPRKQILREENIPETSSPAKNAFVSAGHGGRKKLVCGQWGETPTKNAAKRLASADEVSGEVAPVDEVAGEVVPTTDTSNAAPSVPRMTMVLRSSKRIAAQKRPLEDLHDEIDYDRAEVKRSKLSVLDMLRTKKKSSREVIKDVSDASQPEDSDDVLPRPNKAVQDELMQLSEALFSKDWERAAQSFGSCFSLQHLPQTLDLMPRNLICSLFSSLVTAPDQFRLTAAEALRSVVEMLPDTKSATTKNHFKRVLAEPLVRDCVVGALGQEIGSDRMNDSVLSMLLELVDSLFHHIDRKMIDDRYVSSLIDFVAMDDHIGALAGRGLCTAFERQPNLSKVTYERLAVDARRRLKTSTCTSNYEDILGLLIEECTRRSCFAKQAQYQEQVPSGTKR